MRLFLALPLDESLLAGLTRLTTRLRGDAPNLRWSAPEAWHITLQFLGATTPEQYACVIDRLSRLKNPPVPIKLAAPGVFPRAGVFHLGVEPTPALLTLQQRIAAATAPCGFETEDRPYHPHITLARAKGRDGARDLRALASHLPAETRLPRFTAREFLVFESHLSSAGSRYEIRHRFPLAQA
jgi:RNA 2',3'-cyclic 3'-phosphodiesterase